VQAGAIRVIRGSLFLFSGYRLYLSQQSPEFALIYLNPIIQVKEDSLVGIVL